MSETKYPKVRGKIIEVYGSQRAFAEAIGKTEQTVTAKLTAKSPFSMDDIKEWSTALQIATDSIGDYFFTHEVSKS